MKGNACHSGEAPDSVGTRGAEKEPERNIVKPSRQSYEERRHVLSHFPTLSFHSEVAGRRDFDGCNGWSGSCRGVVQVGGGGLRTAWFSSSGGLNSTC